MYNHHYTSLLEVLKFSLEDFGIKASLKENPYREDLLKLVYSASDYEAKSYLEILKTLKLIIKNK